MCEKTSQPLDEIPNINDYVRAKIEAHLNQLKSFNGKISEEDWMILERALLDYQREIFGWRGYLKVGEHVSVETAIKTAGKLHIQLEALMKKGLAWPVSNALSPSRLDKFVDELDRIAKHDLGTRTNEGSLPDIKADAKEKASADLQIAIDKWYQRLTGLGPSMENEDLSESHYGCFIKYVFLALHADITLGISRAAVHDRRAYEGREQRKQKKRLDEEKWAAHKLKQLLK